MWQCVSAILFYLPVLDPCMYDDVSHSTAYKREQKGKKEASEKRKQAKEQTKEGQVSELYALRLWNWLPENVRSASSIDCFKESSMFNLALSY